MTSCLLLYRMKLFQKGSSLKRKNSLLGEKIIFFKSQPLIIWEAKLNIKELLLLKVYPFTLRASWWSYFFLYFQVHHSITSIPAVHVLLGD